MGDVIINDITWKLSNVDHLVIFYMSQTNTYYHDLSDKVHLDTLSWHCSIGQSAFKSLFLQINNDRLCDIKNINYVLFDITKSANKKTIIVNFTIEKN
jgi:hypothetical protein